MKKYILLCFLFLSIAAESQVRVIPVVVHVLHYYGEENITDYQVRDAIDRLTIDFRKLNADTVDIIPVFKPIAADCEIEFHLANIDPNGNCTNGIEHVFTSRTFFAGEHSKIHNWPNNKYLNIWIVNSLTNSSAVGYTHFPGGADSTDGIMMLHNYFGSIGTSNPVNPRQLTHQLGFYLNLLSPWQSGSFGSICGDDGVMDTPETMGSSSCNLSLSVCNPPIIENVQNFMEFSYCNRMFTQGQKARMRALLDSTVNGRNNLWTPANLAATGTDGSPVTICSPVADFIGADGCVGDPIAFKNMSWNAPITSWSWSFPGGNPSMSTDSNPTVTYATAGFYDATLIVTSATGIDTITKSAIVHITDTAQLTIPYSEDFESVNSLVGVDGWIDNIDQSSTCLWTRTSIANTTPGGSYCIKIDNYNNSANEIDAWVSPSIDFSNITFPIIFKFQVANAQRSNVSDDELGLYYSINCGESWQFTSYVKAGAILSTAGVVPIDFTPGSTSQWRQETVTINAVQNKPNVRFKFTNKSDNGNNIYIDDINITGTITGVNETNLTENDFVVFPNPSAGISKVEYSITKNADVKITVHNIVGELIFTTSSENKTPGYHEVMLPSLSPGVYLVELNVNGKRFYKKLITS